MLLFWWRPARAGRSSVSSKDPQSCHLRRARVAVRPWSGKDHRGVRCSHFPILPALSPTTLPGTPPRIALPSLVVPRSIPAFPHALLLSRLSRVRVAHGSLHNPWCIRASSPQALVVSAAAAEGAHIGNKRARKTRATKARVLSSLSRRRLTPRSGPPIQQIPRSRRYDPSNQMVSSTAPARDATSALTARIMPPHRNGISALPSGTSATPGS